MPPHILLVDDNAIQGSTRGAILTRTGFKVAVAQQAREALALLERIEVRASLQLLITDHFMPGMNGPELVRIVHSILPALPIMVLSGLAETEEEYEDLQVSFHVKPFSPEELIKVVNKLTGESVLRSA